VGLAAVAGAVMTALSACSVKDAFSFGWPQGGISLQSQKMFDLWIGSAVAALAVGFFVWGLIFWCVVRYRKRGELLPPQTRYNLPIEMVYTVVPFLIVSVLFYYTAITQTDVNKTTANPDVVVNIEAFRWNWKFSYPATKGSDGRPVSTVGSSELVPVLVVPTHETIRFVEHSPDVIHSFWVPELLFKRDVFPGNVVNQFEVTITSEGSYVGRCAELCGAYHSMMSFELRAVSPQKFTQFLAAKAAGRSTPEALAAIGEAPLATTTSPFPTKRDTTPPEGAP
jgi:cytochrome c oxidase subunit II